MINQISKITVYVDNQNDAKDFWLNKMQFVVRLEQDMGNFVWLEVAPNENAQTSFVLYEKALMQKINPQANVTHPNVILSGQKISETYEVLKQCGVEVGELMIMPYGKMFKFKDQDANEYLIRED